MSTARGLEVLLKKASIDAEFRALLLESRSQACVAIGLQLDPAEAAMLNTMPAQQLDAIIQRTCVRPEDRRVFLGQAASVMLAALGAGVSGCRKKSEPGSGPRPTSRGHAADNPGRARPAPPQPPSTPQPDSQTDATC